MERRPWRRSRNSFCVTRGMADFGKEKGDSRREEEQMAKVDRKMKASGIRPLQDLLGFVTWLGRVGWQLRSPFLYSTTSLWTRKSSLT